MNSGANPSLEIKAFVVGSLYTNCYVAHDKSSGKGILIDPGAYEPDILDHIRDNGIDVEFTLNTHGHWDHVLGDADFGFPVLIHELDGPCLADPEVGKFFSSGKVVKPEMISRFLLDGDIIELGGLSMTVLHTPGHTPGSISLRCGDVLFSGDTLFCEGIGRTDLPGGDPEAMLISVRDKLFKLPDDVRVLPGHGPETTIGHEKQNNPYFGNM
jgi:glyoxylase-like metal-dependent hydrolase (beta-lactamase superfamily II)